MLVASPTPDLAAEWHRVLNVAAAKLAVAAGVAPADVRRVSGLRRVEMRRSPTQIRRQMAALKKAATLTEDQVSNVLVNEVETVERILSGRCAEDLGSKYLQLCQQARRHARLHEYFDHVEEFNREFVALTDEFERCRRKFRELGEQYASVGERLHTATAVPSNAPWPVRRRMQTATDQLVEERDSLRALLAFTGGQLATTMDRYRRHQAKRVYFHSRTVPEFRDPSTVFVPASSLHKMLVCPHEEKRPPSQRTREAALRLMREWNIVCEEFAVERRSMLLEHRTDALRDHTLRSMLAATSRSSASKSEELIDET